MNFFSLCRVVLCILISPNLANVIHRTLDRPGWSRIVEEFLLANLKAVDVIFSDKASPWHFVIFSNMPICILFISPFSLDNMLRQIDWFSDFQIDLDLVGIGNMFDSPVAIDELFIINCLTIWLELVWRDELILLLFYA